MDAAFIGWAREEIGRLRAEADLLAKTLDRYVTAQGGGARAVPKPAPVRAASGPASRRPTKATGRRSKNAPILDIIDRAGPEGLALSDIQRSMSEGGRPVNINNLRTFLFNQKKANRVTSVGRGRYATARSARQPDGDTPSAGAPEGAAADGA